MKKILFVLILIWFWPVSRANCQSPASGWIFLSELSPTLRSGNNRILQPNESFHLEWRNRLGKMITGNTAVGLMGTYRHYRITEQMNYSPETNAANYVYHYHVNNSLWGTGPFVTRFFQIRKNLLLQATLYGLYEMGSGHYEMTLQGHDCPGCFTPGLNFAGRTGNIENQRYREKSFYGGMDVGASYSMTPRLSLNAAINLVQYEHYNISEGNRISPALSTSPLYRRLNVQGDQITFVIYRPILHFGIMLAIGKQTTK